MRRFTQTELDGAQMLAGFGSIEKALDVLVDARGKACRYVAEMHPSFLP